MTYEKSFDTIDEFVDNISRGGEVELEYNGNLYFAGMIGENKWTACEQHNDESSKEYVSAEEVCSYPIEDKTIGEVITKAKITFRCFE